PRSRRHRNRTDAASVRRVPWSHSGGLPSPRSRPAPRRFGVRRVPAPLGDLRCRVPEVGAACGNRAQVAFRREGKGTLGHETEAGLLQVEAELPGVIGMEGHPERRGAGVADRGRKAVSGLAGGQADAAGHTTDQCLGFEANAAKGEAPRILEIRGTQHPLATDEPLREAAAPFRELSVFSTSGVAEQPVPGTRPPEAIVYGEHEVAAGPYHPRGLAKNSQAIFAAVKVFEELAHEESAIETVGHKGKRAHFGPQPLNGEPCPLCSLLAIREHRLDEIHGNHAVALPRSAERFAPGPAAEVEHARAFREAQPKELLLGRVKTLLVSHLCVGRDLPGVVVAAVHQGKRSGHEVISPPASWRNEAPRLSRRRRPSGSTPRSWSSRV